MIRNIAKDKFALRTTAMTVVLFAVFGLIGAKLFKLQILQGGQKRKQAEEQHSVVQRLLPSRGEILLLDKLSGQTSPAATNIKKFFAYAVPPRVKSLQLTAAALAGALDLKEAEVLEKISGNKKYVILKKHLNQEEQDKLKELKLAGIYLDAEEARFYSEKNFLSQTLGFVGYKQDKRAGLYGLERYFDKELSGAPGLLSEDKDPAGAWIFGGRRDITPAQDGVNLILTIDKNIQFKAETVLKEAVEKHGADSGSVIVVNPKTGEILALAGFPNFDPNEYGKVSNPELFGNDAAIGSYEPGSVFKPITMAAALNEGKVQPDTVYTDSGKILIDGYTIKNSDGKAHGVQNMTQVLDESLNTGAIFAKEQIGNKKFLEYVKKFGFGRPTGVELLEGKGNLDNLAGNIAVNYHTASFGQGILVTPLQLVQAYTAIANQGKMMKPFLVASKIYPDGRTENIKPGAVIEAISPKTANTLAAMLVSVVENGHGKRAGVSGYEIAGKTGTAQVARKDKKGYEEDNNIGSFIGFGPAENPQFLMLVRVNHPRSVKFAESTAAPAFGEIAQFILNYLHIPPTKN